MYEVTVEQTFAAGHFLRNYKGKDENKHGHNYRVEITVQGEHLDDTGMLVDFLDLKRAMEEVVSYFDHNFINDLPPFDRVNPSAENLAKYVFDEVQRRLGGSAPVSIAQVKIWETDTSAAVYRPA